MDIPPPAQIQFEKSFFEGDLPSMGAAIQAGADPLLEIRGFPALWFCARYSWMERAEALLAAGADPWSGADAEDSPIGQAVALGDRGLALMLGRRAWRPRSLATPAELLALGAARGAERASLALECLGDHGRAQRQELLDAALALAWNNRSEAAVALLIQLGADPWIRARDPVETEDADSMFEGLDEDEDDDEAGGRFFETPGQIPLAMGMVSLGWAGVVLDCQLDFSGAARAGEALRRACDALDAGMLRALSLRGCRPGDHPRMASSAMDALCAVDMRWEQDHARQIECARALVELGTPIDGEPGSAADTPLMLALKAESLELASALLDLGADPLIERSGRSPMKLSKRFKDEPAFAGAWALMRAAKEGRELGAAVPPGRSAEKKAAL